ncbi:hypothetical protein P7C71_g4949, partial [Lecanoromycetidae sp. Uapishka_2]
MGNRKERRAQARTTPITGNDIHLSQPNRDEPKQKSLLEIAAERQLLGPSPGSSAPSITTTKINADGSLTTTEDSPVEAALEATPYLDVALYTTTLTLLNFTLTVLVEHQYAAEALNLRSLFYSSTVASPTPILLLILVAILHPRSAHPVTQVLFASLSVIAGAWLVHASNEDPYLAVMQKAPPLGTLWVWAVVEMRWEWALGCLGIVAGWGWWNGYSIV